MKKRIAWILVWVLVIARVGLPNAWAAPSSAGPTPQVDPLGGTPPGGSPQAFVLSLRTKSHPYLFFDQDDLATLRAKRSQAPYDAFYRPIKSWADDAVNIGVRKAGAGAAHPWITERAMRTGLVYVIEADDKYLQAVEDFIASITQSELDAILADYGTVHLVHSHYAVLYDLVGQELTSSTRAKFEGLLADMVVRYIDDFDDWNYRPTYPALSPHFRFPTNHGTRGESGVCLTAMAMPQHPDAPAWMDRCLRMFNFLFSNIAGDEGIWIEGPGYFDFGIDPFFEFGFAYYNLTGVNAFALTDPPMHQILDAMIKIRRPDGYGPQYSDSGLSFVNQTTLAGMLPDGAYHMWSQEVFGDESTAPVTPSTVMDFLFYQPVAPVEPPWGMTTFFTDDQVAVFRRDFTRESSYAFVRGFDRPFGNHEHYDQASFQFYAYGTPLIVDGGYCGWQCSRNEYLTDLLYPEGHSLVLVDGTGPRKDEHRENDVFVLERYAASPFLDTTDIVGDYNHTGSMPEADGGVSDCTDIITGAPCDAAPPYDSVTDVAVNRTFYFPKAFGPESGQEYLVVIDEVRSTGESPADHDYSLLLHGPTTSFTRDGPAYRWTTTNAAGEQVTLLGYTVASGPIDYATRTWYHFAPEYSDRGAHTRLELSLKDATRAVYLTLLFPYTQGMNAPTFAPLTGADGSFGVRIQLGSMFDQFIVNPNRASTSISGIQTDAASVFTRHRSSALEKASFKQGTELAVDSKTLFDAPQLVDYVIGEVDPTTGDFTLIAASTPSTFSDVPFSHPYYADIEALYQAGYTAGCATDPLRYCPDQTMNRAESAVFVERGIHGTTTGVPSQPTTQLFADLPLDSWAAKWADALWQDQYTAGCGTDPLIYCPWQGHARAEGCVFYLHMLNGPTYQPPQPSQPTFADIPLDTWYAKWVQAAYDAGLLEPCQTSPELRFCPNDPLTRAAAAYMMVQAKGLR